MGTTEGTGQSVVLEAMERAAVVRPVFKWLHSAVILRMSCAGLSLALTSVVVRLALVLFIMIARHPSAITIRKL